MPAAGDLLEQALNAARHRDWVAYRSRFAELRDALRAGADEELRARLDILNAAAPEHDPEGCVAELESLAPLVAVRPARMTAAEIPLDLRGLEAPQPIVRILERLERAPREPLRVILPHEPLPLYALLRERGYRYSGAARADGGFEVLIEAA